MAEQLWFKTLTLEQLRQLYPAGMADYLGIELTELGPDYLRGTLPVCERTRQPMGLLHGGANVVLAETLGSIAANLCIDTDVYYALGQEINANHLRAVGEGKVTGTAKPVHLGRTTQVWDIRIEDAHGRLSCISRITMAVLQREPQTGPL